MGFYLFDSHEVGPTGKLAKLKAIPGAALWDGDTPPKLFRSDGNYPVYWVDNGTFEAVAIAYDKRELDRLTEGMEGRPYECYLVPTEELVKLKPHLAEYLRGERSWRA